MKCCRMNYIIYTDVWVAVWTFEECNESEITERLVAFHFLLVVQISYMPVWC
jgi:hypothetical protein